MNPGQRINLFKKVARRLAEMSFSDGDLILRQFNFPWTDQWEGSGNAYSYYLEMIERGKDEDLVDLHEYLFPRDPLPGVAAADSGAIWKTDYLGLFLSHSSKRALQVTQIKNELLSFGIDAFVAHQDIEPTSEWLTEIRKALSSCHAFAAIICGDFQSSHYCDQEVGFALQRGILVIPVRVELDPYGFMAPLQGISAFNLKPSEIASELRKLIVNHPTTRDAAAAAERASIARLGDDFLNSSNFGTSTELLKRLESYGKLPRVVVEKIAASWEKNDQIAKCMGIPRRMEVFLKRHLA